MCPRYHLEASVGVITTIQNLFAGTCVIASTLFFYKSVYRQICFSGISLILAVVVSKYSLLIYSLTQSFIYLNYFESYCKYMFIFAKYHLAKSIINTVV